MRFLIYCIDDPKKPGSREKMRAEHLRYMIAHRDRILFGGPLRNAEDTRSIGSAFALDYDARADVDAFLAAEPYCAAGVFSSVTVHPLHVMVPERHPGFLDKQLEQELARASSVQEV
jgi:uncharacterized protein YciI